MWYPGQGVSNEVIQLILAALNDTQVKAELSRQIRIELDSERNKYKGSVPSYESLTSGNVNMQAKMAASGYDVYGRTIIAGNTATSNNNVYKKMKNKIKYRSSPEDGYRNRGNFNIV